MPLESRSLGSLRRESPRSRAELRARYRAGPAVARWQPVPFSPASTPSTTTTADLGADDRADIMNKARDHCPDRDPAEGHLELIDMVGLLVAMKTERDELGGVGAEQRERLPVHGQGAPRGQDRVLRLQLGRERYPELLQRREVLERDDPYATMDPRRVRDLEGAGDLADDDPEALEPDRVLVADDGARRERLRGLELWGEAHGQ